MGASRKLQGEIDRVLKKVHEGVDVFDSIWNKVYDTDNANQKEKFEADLKKEIKKLQRYRDQIKTWIQSSEIKDKKVSASYEQALMDARKLIEREMERFKICEKETKTKAFSKEGLVQQPKTDPREKAKSETRDWLNTMVSELESQIDNFEAEMEGLSVKKGKTRPPRLIHLETSITRHKAHIMKLELILRLLDNDDLSPEEVNDVKEMLEDYVERNQEDFEEFGDVDELYNSLPLDKVESLEDLVTVGPPGIIKGGSATSAVLSLKTSLPPSPTQIPTTVAATSQHNNPILEHVDEIASLDNNADISPRTPPTKNNAIGSSATFTPGGSHAAAAIAAPHNSTNMPSASAVPPGSNPPRVGIENSGAANSNVSSSLCLPNAANEEENANFPGRRPSPSLVDMGLVRGTGRGGLSSQPATSIPLSSGGILPINGLGALPSAADIAKRNILSADERVTSTGIVTPLVSPLSNRMLLPQGAKANDGTISSDSGNASEVSVMAGRFFPPPGVPGMQWRPGSSFQTPNEAGQGQVRGRTEILPDQREKFLERLEQVQQMQQNSTSYPGMPTLSGGNHKQFSAQQQNPLLQQFNPQSSSGSGQVGLGLGFPNPGLNTVTSASLQQQRNSIQQQSNQQAFMSTGQKEADFHRVDENHDADVGLMKADEQQNPSDDSTAESAPSSGHGKNIMNEDDFKSSYATETSAGVSASLPEASQGPRDVDLSPRQPLQSNQTSASLGVIGRRSAPDLGSVSENVSTPAAPSAVTNDHLYNLQMLEAAYHKLPQPKDSERARTYSPRHPAVTPASYPQVQAPIVNNPAFWERLGGDTVGTDTLFFSFYYQQNTYQQYLAAKELKRLSWRYHRKYNTWFQRHEEPKVATDEYEQGTYVYFDFHIVDDLHGWCQRIKTEFTFEYNYLEDELTP